MARYQIEWQSTPAERYETDMNDRARTVVAGAEVTLVEDYGGTDGTTADNGFVIDGTAPQAYWLAGALADEVGHECHVTAVES